MSLRGISEIGIRDFGDADIKYDLTLGQPDFKVPRILKNALKKAVNLNQNGYIRTGGDLIVREILGKELSDIHPNLGEYSKDYGLIVTPGTTSALYVSILSCCEIGDDILLADPYFPPYVDMIRLAGANPVFFPVSENLRIDVESIQKNLTPKTKAILLNSPNNPAGYIMSKEELCAVIEFCADRKIRIISDEVYSVYSYDKPHVSAADFTRDAFVLNGFSKSHGVTGWRVGYAIVPIEIAKDVESILGRLYVSAPSICHYAIPAMLTYDVSRFVSVFRKRREIALHILNRRFPKVACDGGMYVFPNIFDTCGCSGSDFALALRKRGVAVLPGKLFSQSDTHFRISLTNKLKDLESALKIIVDTVDDVSEI